mmetsp:Transcript_38747/g.97605  ORF Transcript_38747/g.97605 Transcript_38747/m.97605 type:complete len:141 (+) Transcript_38747:167-589(+)
MFVTKTEVQLGGEANKGGETDDERSYMFGFTSDKSASSNTSERTDSRHSLCLVRMLLCWVVFFFFFFFFCLFFFFVVASSSVASVASVLLLRSWGFALLESVANTRMRLESALLGEIPHLERLFDVVDARHAAELTITVE